METTRAISYTFVRRYLCQTISDALRLAMVDFQYENLTFFPVLHGKLEFAEVVRRALLADPPDVVAVELPSTWRAPLIQAVNRLPFLSLLLDEEGEESHAFLAVEPTDALIEAVRTARELGLPVELIDLDMENYPMEREPLPDTFALRDLGYHRFVETYLKHAPVRHHPEDERRETMMAHALQQLLRNGTRIACVLGAAHVHGVMARLSQPQPRPLARARSRRITLYNWSLKSSMECMAEAPYLAAAYERWRTTLPGTGPRPGRETAAPEPPAGGEAGPRPGQETAQPSAVHREWGGVDREIESEEMLRQAAAAYREHYLEELNLRQLERLGTFAIKYARVDRLMVPDLFHLVTAARGVVDDDLAYEVWDLSSHYPWQDGSGLLPTIDLEETAAYVKGRRMTLHRKIRRRRPQLKKFSRRKRLRERHGESWKSEWSGMTICSHQPEDLVIEDYGRYLRHKAASMLSAERSRVEPFQVSLKDGVDIRETLRNWHEKKLYVREEGRMSGGVGSVVVVFDTDRNGRHDARPDARDDGPGDGPGDDGMERYPWRVTWLGEHDQESDMAFYATEAGENLVGPGISRCEYGGFVMTYPPMRMIDVWNDPAFQFARDKTETLLMVGLDYAEERNVLYVAEKPPRTWFQTLAGRMGKTVIYLPLGQLDPGTLRKIRSFHVLDGKEVRDHAPEYIR